MLRLIYKDLIVYKQQLIAMCIVTVFFAADFVAAIPSELEAWEAGLMLCLGSIVVMLVLGMFQQGILEQDESQLWHGFISSASNGVRKQIGSKYIFGLMISAFGVLVMQISFWSWEAIGSFDLSMYNMLLYDLLVVQLVMCAVELPFLVFFGSKLGGTFRMIATGVIFFAAAAYMLFGDISAFASVESVVRWFKDLLDGDNTYLTWVALGGALVLYGLSYLISCKLYKNEKKYN